MKRKRSDSHDVFEAMAFRDDACFLCGSSLRGRKTREHVFPQWLLKRHDLRKGKLTLLNGSSFKYEQLTIPCCSSCNNEHLSRLESEVCLAFQRGYSAVKKLPASTLYKWAGKIFYGILRKELQLYADLRDRSKGTIVASDLLEGFSTLHLFLQSIRRPFKFHGGDPFSVLTVHLHHGGDLGDFDFRDHLPTMTVAIRSHDVGLIVSLQDGGIIRHTYGKYVRSVAGRLLVPIQFVELFAKVVYQTSLLTRIPKFVTGAHATVDVHMLPLQGLSNKPIVNEWRQEEYARCLAAVLASSFPEFSFDKIFVPPGRVMTWMNDEHGKLTLWNPDGSRASPTRSTNPKNV